MLISRFFILTLPILVLAYVDEQSILAPPPDNQDMSDPSYTPLTRPQPTLADLLTIESSASIYYSYARETELSTEFSSGERYLTLLVPTNKAVMALSRKPHEGPDEPRIGLSEQQYDEESKRNVQAWVSAHVIPSRVSLFEVPATYDTALEGKSVTFIRAPKSTAGSPDWARVTLEDGTRIAGMKEGINGVLYLIDGTINPY